MAADGTSGFSLKGFERSLTKGKPAPVYFLYGSDGYRLKQAAAAVKRRVLKEADPDTGWCVYDLVETAFAQVLDDVLTVSFFGGLRGVAVTNLAIEGDRGDRANPLDAENQKRLIEYVKNPSPDVVLLLLAEKTDMRQKFWKELAANTEAMAFDEPKQWEKKRLVGEMLAESDLQFDAEAWKWIVENFEQSYQQLETEFQKLEVYMGGEKKVSLADLEECMNAPRSDSVFKLTSAIASGKVEESLQLIYKLKNQGEVLLIVIAMIARQFRILLVLKSLGKNNLSPGEKARRCGVNRFFLREYENQAANFSLEKLKWIIRLLSLTDIQIKRSSLNGWMILEKTVISLTTGRKEATA